MKSKHALLTALFLLPLLGSAQVQQATAALKARLASARPTDSLTLIVQLRNGSTPADVRILASYPGAGAYVVRVQAGEVPRMLRDKTLVVADIAQQPREELTTGSLDLTLNRINLAHRAFPTINGDSIVISIKEQRFDTTDIDYKNRVLTSGQAAATFSSHAATMATLAAGAGNSSPYAEGAAPAALLTSATFAILLPQPDSIYQRYRISVQNHSYGTVIENNYGIEASAYDAAVAANSTLLPVFSSGNSGTSSAASGPYLGIPGFANLTGNFKMAKNALVVGATDSFSVVAALSSKGPANDGRVKPELVAFGEDGSSGAAALTSGTAALVQQAYKATHGQALPPASLVRAVLINSADDIGTPHVDYSSGYGSLNAYEAVATVLANRISTGSLANGQTQTIPISVPAGIAQMKLTIAWTDPSVTANTTKALVNDLNAVLRLPATGESWLPWVTEPTPSLIQQPATRKVDTLNNNEQITLDNPAPGIYQLDVTGTRVLTSTQSYSIAWQLDTVNQFYWTFPVRGEPVASGAQNVIRWQTNRPGSGQIEYTTDGVAWTHIATVPLAQRSFKWNVPSLVSTARLRMRVSGPVDILSDSFSISAAPVMQVGFDCADSFLLHWNKQPVAAYQLYELGARYLQPFAAPTDTFAILKKAQHPSLYYAVAPLVGGRPGMRSFTIKYDALGVGCYFKSFYIQLQQGGSVTFTATVGSLFNVSSLAFQKRDGGAWKTLTTIANPGVTDFTFSDTGLNRGISYYRLQIALGNGALVTSDIVPVYYFPDLPVIVYPNPVRRGNPIRLLSQDPVRYTARIFDVSGRVLRTQKLADVTNTVPTDFLAPGVYFIRITGETGTVTTQKIVVYQ
ncbi:MAG: hypothetical protein JWP27_219 [Flaviaesturariibacter sp.]|nr:hypothetical protein [Flaviaesturariibacter sp.]